MDAEQIKTVESFNQQKYKVKDSTFIAQVYPITKDEEALNIIEEARKKFFDASHHCFAYKILGNKIKYSDSGEPSGSAGVRILNAIEHYKLTNILVIVIRYFGGTKLGIGPLGKAYYDSTSLVLEASKIIYKRAYKRLKIKSGFEHINSILRILTKFKVIIKNSSYSNEAEFESLVINKDLKKFVLELNEKSKGKAELKIDEGIEFL